MGAVEIVHLEGQVADTSQEVGRELFDNAVFPAFTIHLDQMDLLAGELRQGGAQSDRFDLQGAGEHPRVGGHDAGGSASDTGGGINVEFSKTIPVGDGSGHNYSVGDVVGFQVRLQPAAVLGDGLEAEDFSAMQAGECQGGGPNVRPNVQNQAVGRVGEVNLVQLIAVVAGDFGDGVVKRRGEVAGDGQRLVREPERDGLLFNAGGGDEGIPRIHAKDLAGDVLNGGFDRPFELVNRGFHIGSGQSPWRLADRRGYWQGYLGRIGLEAGWIQESHRLGAGTRRPPPPFLGSTLGWMYLLFAGLGLFLFTLGDERDLSGDGIVRLDRLGSDRLFPCARVCCSRRG